MCSLCKSHISCLFFEIPNKAEIFKESKNVLEELHYTYMWHNEVIQHMVVHWACKNHLKHKKIISTISTCWAQWFCNVNSHDNKVCKKVSVEKEGKNHILHMAQRWQNSLQKFRIIGQCAFPPFLESTTIVRGLAYWTFRSMFGCVSQRN